MNQQPTASEIENAKSRAVGGGRKRCTRGKSCSAACIDPNEDCLVEFPGPVNVAITKASKLLNAGGTTESAPASATRRTTSVLKNTDGPPGARPPLLEEIYERQKYNGKPELVERASDLKNRNDTLKYSDGSPIIMYRGVTSKAFADQFRGLGKDGSVHFPGRGIFGRGSYSAAGNALDPSKTLERAIDTAKDYAGRGPYNKKVVAFSLRDNANIITFPGSTYEERSRAFSDWSDRVVKEAREKTGYNFQEVGSSAAALGYHAFQVPRQDEDYFVILDRGAVVAAKDSEL